MQRATWLLIAAFAASVLGCSADEARFRQHMAFKRKMERSDRIVNEVVLETPPAVTQDVADIVAALFGTPDAPNMPVVEGVETAEIVDMRRLKMAAGPVGSDQDGRPHGLYREHCVHCHGITGDGAGPTATFLNPYPRDYRMGLYKFKSTKKGEKPTHEDLKRIVLNGVPGTAMPSFALLPDYEVDALVDYVRYLSIRGEVERELFRYFNSDVDDPLPTLYSDYITLSERREELINGGVPSSELREASRSLSRAFGLLTDINGDLRDYDPPDEEEEVEPIPAEERAEQVATFNEEVAALLKGAEEYKTPRMIVTANDDGSPKTEAEIKEQLAPYVELAGGVMQKWIGQQSTEVPEPPTPLDPNDQESIARGRAIFYGPIANCFSCHGESGLGDGQRDFYDEWSGEWVEKNAPEATHEYVEVGALPPRNLIPRNLRLGVYRGGRRPVDLYWRLVNGIDGAQMPAVPLLAADAPADAKGLTQQDLWDLINYVRSLPYESISQPTREEVQLAKEVQ